MEQKIQDVITYLSARGNTELAYKLSNILVEIRQANALAKPSNSNGTNY